MLIMLTFLIQVSYTSKAWSTLVQDPQSRLDILRPTIENLGGKLESSYLAFGDFDVVGIIQLPNNVSAAALSMAMMAGGGITKLNIVTLMTWTEGVEAMKKAKNAAYTPPTTSQMFDKR